MIPMRVASNKLVLHKTWSIGVIVPILAPLFWILIILMKLENKIADIVPAIVKTVPFLIFTWSKHFITSSLSGPIFTIRRNATIPSKQRTINNNWIIFTLKKKSILFIPSTKTPKFLQRTNIIKKKPNQELGRSPCRSKRCLILIKNLIFYNSSLKKW